MNPPAFPATQQFLEKGDGRMPIKKNTGLPRAPRHPTSCRQISPGCCADRREVLNRQFRRENRKYLSQRAV